MLATALALLCGACGIDDNALVLSKGPDAGGPNMGAADTDCELVEMDGDILVRQVDEVTARFRVGAAYTKTVMLFGGEPVTIDNAVSNVYVIGLDKADALMLAKSYPDFYLCDSPGGQEAQNFIIDYDLVPASCRVYEQIAKALREFHIANAAGADRVSLRFEGAPLELESVVFDSNGHDVTDQLADNNFHLVTSVEQLTGQSVVNFGTSE